MNILVVCDYGLYQDLTFSFVHNQAREYAALGHRVRVIIPNGIGKRGPGGERIFPMVSRREADGVELIDLRYVTLSRFGEKRFNTASAIAAIRTHWGRIFGDFCPDLIHAHTLGFDSEIGAWLKGQLSCPLVVTTHGGDTFVPFTAGRKKELKGFADQADVVVCVSSLLRRHLEACGAASRLDVILNGFNVRYVQQAENKEPFSLIQVGNLIPRKKNDVTIKAVADLRKQYPQVTLTVVGDGPERPALEELCRQLGVEDAVRFTGRVPNDRVHELMAQAGYFIMPSVKEGFGIVYVEAMAAGCVTVGTEGEGIADVIRNGVNGFLVPADDPQAIVRIIEQCVSNPERTMEIAENGRRDAQSLTWRENAEAYLRLFDALKRKQPESEE